MSYTVDELFKATLDTLRTQIRLCDNRESLKALSAELDLIGQHAALRMVELWTEEQRRNRSEGEQ